MKIIRKMQASDLEALIEIQKKSFSADLCEDLSVFENRFDHFGEYFHVALLDNEIVGYIIAFPYTLGEIPKNNTFFKTPFKTPNCFYIHDITLSSNARGTGLAKLLIDSAFELAKNMQLNKVALVAVEQSGNYWDRLGFVIDHDNTSKVRELLKESYGDNARLMIKN